MKKDKRTGIEHCRDAFSAILSAIDKTKLADMIQAGKTVEGVMDRMAAVLAMLRDYFIKRDGKAADDLPFVQEIDRLVPRLPKKGRKK